MIVWTVSKSQDEREQDLEQDAEPWLHGNQLVPVQPSPQPQLLSIELL